MHYDVSPRSVHAYILGEHGDSEIPAWSSASIGGLPVLENTINGVAYDRPVLNDMFCQVKNAAYQIIANKGYTNWAIGLVIASMVRTITGDQHRILPVSVHLSGEYGIEGVCLSVPAIVALDGVKNFVLPELNADELKGLQHSAETLLEPVKQLGLL